MNLRNTTFYTFLIVSAFGLSLPSCLKESNFEIVVDTTKIAKVYQPNGINGKDAIIESITPDQNSGSSTHFTIFSWTNGGSFNSARALIEFDLSSTPPQTLIKSAKLSLYWISYQNLTEQTGDNAFSIYKIIQPWEENSVNWNNQPLINDIKMVSIPKSTSVDQSYTDIDVSALVQDMIDYPSENHGFMLKLIEELPYRLVIFASSNSSESSKQPKLQVYY